MTQCFAIANSGVQCRKPAAPNDDLCCFHASTWREWVDQHGVRAAAIRITEGAEAARRMTIRRDAA